MLFVYSALISLKFHNDMMARGSHAIFLDNISNVGKPYNRAYIST